MKYSKIIKKNIYNIFSYCIFLFFLLNGFVNAQGIDNSGSQTPNIGNLQGKTFQQLVADFFMIASDYILVLLIALTVFVFLWGLMKYMFKGQGSDTARTEGRKLMLWGVIGLFVMTSVWGLVTVLASFIGHTDIFIPQF